MNTDLASRAMRAPRLACLTVVATLSAAPPSRAGDDGQGLAEVALARCLASFDSSLPADAPRVPAPPGLARSARVEVVALPNRDGRLFAYRGSADELACGVALYGEVSPATRSRLASALDGDKRWMRHAPGPYGLDDARPAHQAYWGDPRAPGLSGALMLERPSSPSAPTVEIDVHEVLVP